MEPFTVCAVMFGVGLLVGWYSSRQGTNWPNLLLAASLGSGANGFVLTAMALMELFISAGPNERPLGIFYPPIFAIFLLFTFGWAAIFTTFGCLIGFAARLLRPESGDCSSSSEMVDPGSQPKRSTL